MRSLVHRPPRHTTREAERIAHEHFAIAAGARPLPSERDQNFLLTDVSGTHTVLKFSQTGEDLALLECQHQMLDRVAEARRAEPDGMLARFEFPRVIPTTGGARITEVTGTDGGVHFMRALTWVPGRPLATARPHDDVLLREVGTLIGALASALQGFDHPAARRTLHWDLRHARNVIGQHIDEILRTDRRALIQSFLPLLDAAAPLCTRLRTSVIHGDANDWNVLVLGPPADDLFAGIHVNGIVDFGDVVHSWTVADLAIACAYAMLGKRDPLAAACHVVNGWHEAFPLPEREIDALFPLVCARLCTSVALSAYQRGQQPDNTYLSISEAPAWELLDRLAGLHPRLAGYTLRDACGLPAVPGAPHVAAWIARERENFAPVLGEGPEAAHARALTEVKPLTLDLSMTSLDFPDAVGPYQLRRWSDAIDQALRAAGTRVGIGRYDEARPWYLGSAFRTETDTAPESRTVHIGVDFFAEPGTPVFAPLEGIVHGWADHDATGDYGPTIVLAHQTADGTPFWTLWGHLSRESLTGLAVGARVPRGERIGRIGDATVNGGWPPHVHLQLITDLLDHAATFPGIARPGPLRVWRSLSPDPGALAGLAAPGAPVGSGARETGHPRPTRDGAASRATLLERRELVLSEALSIAYRSPLVIVRGWMQHLYDEMGQMYLDAVNNVAHVGHAHPRVTEAIRRQAAVLNTNTRYLHRTILDYAERLTATLPTPLRVCFLVCSGSEANELALRLARAHTGRQDIIVLEGGYHGNTTSLIDISPYKFAGPGGRGAPAHVHVAPLPDPYRGRYRGEDAGKRHVADLAALIANMQTAGAPPGAFIAEPLPGCGGQIVPAAGFLAGAFRAVRAAGGVCIADEVQTGLGRVGSHFWAFETQDALPDIVTIGKPIGNGHPLGAVITTPEIAASFANGMEYFNTFGGNPVSCAAGMAVLDVIEDEALQQNAARVGAHLLAGLGALMGHHTLVGDARGCGLYIGVELVLDRETRSPAGTHASYVINRMRDHGILLSTDGPDHNVLKIKPPLVFNEADADRLVETLDRVLGEDAVRIG